MDRQTLVGFVQSGRYRPFWIRMVGSGGVGANFMAAFFDKALVPMIKRTRLYRSCNMLHTPGITTMRNGIGFQLAMLIFIAFLTVGFCELATAQDLSPKQIERVADYFGKKQNLRSVEPERGRFPSSFWQYRTIDGTYNNLVALHWGMAGANLFRKLPSAYSDGVSEPAGANRKSARSISNLICWQNNSIPSAHGMSSMVWQWGQFLDHDISITEAADPLEAMPILVPNPDPFFDPFNVGGQQIMMFRSEYRHNRPPSEPREQVNSITSWIDGSNVYGSDFLTAARLRTFERGRLKMSEGGLVANRRRRILYGWRRASQ